MHFLHRNNVDHRDIKPLNILMFNKGLLVKLADFGAARDINSEYSVFTNGVGTTMYVSPESRLGKHLPFISDMFSLGAILHKMMTKIVPDYFAHIK